MFVLIAMVITIGGKSSQALTDLSGPTAVPAGALPTPTLAANVTPVAVRTAEPESVTGNLKKLFGTEFSTQYTQGRSQYGLRPAIWGTFEITFLAMALAIPTALAIGIFAAEFPLGFLGRWLRIILGVLAGIPPIVYALLAIVFVGPFISNKFTGDLQFSTPNPGAQFGVETWPPGEAGWVPWNAGAFPWDPTGQNNSLLLGAIMLALLVIPFIAPLFEDALRNVPREPKEAALGLGATRWYTLRRVTMPRAMPGIIAATGLGTLKVLGDVMIVLFVVGLEANMPQPLFDVLERTGPLTSTGAALVGGFNNPDACQGRDCSVGYFTALVLLVMALLVVTATTLLERRFRKRLGI